MDSPAFYHSLQISIEFCDRSFERFGNVLFVTSLTLTIQKSHTQFDTINIPEVRLYVRRVLVCRCI